MYTPVGDGKCFFNCIHGHIWLENLHWQRNLMDSVFFSFLSKCFHRLERMFGIHISLPRIFYCKFYHANKNIIYEHFRWMLPFGCAPPQTEWKECADNDYKFRLIDFRCVYMRSNKETTFFAWTLFRFLDVSRHRERERKREKFVSKRKVERKFSVCEPPAAILALTKFGLTLELKLEFSLTQFFFSILPVILSYERRLISADKFVFALNGSDVIVAFFFSLFCPWFECCDVVVWMLFRPFLPEGSSCLCATGFCWTILMNTFIIYKEISFFLVSPVAIRK